MWRLLIVNVSLDIGKTGSHESNLYSQEHPQEYLALKDETVKVMTAFSKASIDFFKSGARKHNTQYQKMIRRLCWMSMRHIKAIVEMDKQPLVTGASFRR